MLETTRIVRTRTGDKIHLGSTGAARVYCGATFGYHPEPVKWAPGMHRRFCARCCSPTGIAIVRAIVSFLTQTEV